MQNRLQKLYWRLQDRYNFEWEIMKCYGGTKLDIHTQNQQQKAIFRWVYTCKEENICMEKNGKKWKKMEKKMIKIWYFWAL